MAGPAVRSQWIVDSSSILVMERGSRWFTEVSGPCIALQAEPHETYGDLVRRTYDCIRTIEREDRAVGLAVLSCGGDAGEEIVEHRARLARALLSVVLRADAGRLVLYGSRRMEQELFGLADALSADLPGMTASLSVVLAPP
jgi:hypothetical protein